MKKIILLISLLIISTASAASTSILQVSTSTNGLNPGKAGALTISLTNAGTDIAYDTKVVLKGLDNPLTSNSLCNECITYSSAQQTCLAYQDKCYTNVGDIYGTNGQEAVFKINVPDDIETGVYIADIDVQYGTKNISTNVIESRILNKKVVISIDNDNQKPDVNIKSVIAPDIIHPGDEFNLTIELENNGELTAQELNVEFMSDYLEVKGTTNNQLIGDLNSGSKASITYQVLADAALSPGVYEISFNLNYTDNDNSYTKTQDSGLLIDGESDFDLFIQDISPNIINEGDDITVFINVANVGVLDAKAVSVKINPCDGIELGNLNEDFLGDLDSGDFTSTSFTFKSIGEGEKKLKITVKYTTPNGNKVEFNSTDTMIVRYNHEQAQQRSGFDLNWIIYLILGLIIYYLYKKSKKKSKA